MRHRFPPILGSKLMALGCIDTTLREQKLFLLPNARKKRSTLLDEEVIDQNDSQREIFLTEFKCWQKLFS